MKKLFSARDIRVHDGLVPKPLRDSLVRLIRAPIWAFGWKSDAAKDNFNFWHCHFAGGDSRSRRNCEAELAEIPELAPVYRLWKLLQAGPLKGHEPLRVYANGHTYGVEGQIHT